MGCLLRLVGRLFLLVVLVAALMGVAMYFLPQPGVFVINQVFERGTKDAEKQIASFDPDDVTTLSNIQYRENDGDAWMDVSFPDSTADGEVLPTVVWIHGGAWVSGDKTDYSVYYRMIAAEGFTVVSVNYTLGPEGQYPTPLIQINAAFTFLLANADEYHVDVDNFVLAGDSAGAQITSQLATMITNPEYAAEVGVLPTLAPEQLRGVALMSGIFDVPTMMDESKIGPPLLRWGARTSVWAYTGSKSSDSLGATQMSTINFVTGEFPPTFITGGNGDPLTADQSVPMADKLDDLGVDVTSVFFPDDHDPSLEHEYQFRVDTEDGMDTFNQLINWLQDVTS